MDELVLVGYGKKKTISVNGNMVIIQRKGSLFASERQKSIPINNICGVEVKKPDAFINGYIQIQIPGQISGNSSFSVSGGAYNAVTDENAVVFIGKGNYEIALKIKSYIENYSYRQNVPAHSAQQNNSISDKLKQLKLLCDDGVISEAEFQQKKEQLLREL